jgi:aminocarboxymuconate-semialdehyde decarboxylase
LQNPEQKSANQGEQMSTEINSGIPEIIFHGCSLKNSAQPHHTHANHATQGAAVAGGQRRQTMVGGKRVKTIDVHCHCVIPETLAMAGQRLEDQRGPGIGEVGLRRIREMDEQGMDVEAISINPFWYKVERDVAEKLIKVQNEKLTELCAAHPDRLFGMASVALQYPDLAIQQLEYAIKKLGMKGVAVGGSVAGVAFSDAKFHPFWAKVEEMGQLVFIHPQGTPELNKRLAGNGWLANVIGNPLDTTIALAHLILEGTLDRFPNLKICSAHGGGYLPSYAPRMDNGCRVAPEECNPAINLKKKPTEYLRQMYFDSLVFTDEALRHLVAEVGSSQIVIGTDHPIPWWSTSVDHLLSAPGFTDDERIAMLGGTASKLLGIPQF